MCTVLLCCIFIFQEAAACSCQCYYIAIHWHVQSNQKREVKSVYVHVSKLKNLDAFISSATVASTCAAQTTKKANEKCGGHLPGTAELSLRRRAMGIAQLLVLPPITFVSRFRQVKMDCFAHCLKCLQGLMKVNRGSILKTSCFVGLTTT
jgi:hypothetical protein